MNEKQNNFINGLNLVIFKIIN